MNVNHVIALVLVIIFLSTFVHDISACATYMQCNFFILRMAIKQIGFFIIQLGECQKNTAPGCFTEWHGAYVKFLDLIYGANSQRAVRGQRQTMKATGIIELRVYAQLLVHRRLRFGKQSQQDNVPLDISNAIYVATNQHNYTELTCPDSRPS